MKKIIALLLTAIMIFSLVACGGSAPAADSGAAPAADSGAATAVADSGSDGASAGQFDGVTLEFWMPPINGEDMAYWEPRFEEFKKETGITVNTTIVDWGDMSTKYMAGFMSCDGPDVFYMVNEIMYDMSQAGALMDLAPYYTQEELDNHNFLYGTYTRGDARYSMPFLGETCAYRGYFFNLDLLEKAGVNKIPENWDELIDAAVKVKEAGVCEYPILYPVAEDNASPLATILPMIWSAGADLVSADGESVVIDSPEAVEACQFLYDLSNKYEVLSKDCVTLQTQPAEDLFIEGKVAILGGEANWIEQNYASIPFKLDTRIALSPAGKTPSTFASVDQISANANSKNPEAAVALLKWLTSGPQFETFRETLYASMGQMTKDMSPTPFNSPEIEAEVAANASMGRPLPVCKGLASMTELLKSNEQLLVMGEITPEEAVKAMAEGFQAALDE